MLTDANLCPILQIKCDQYWPSRGTETYGMTQVTLLDTIELATFCVRTFSLHKVRGARLTPTRLQPQSASLSSWVANGKRSNWEMDAPRKSRQNGLNCRPCSDQINLVFT